MAQGDLPEAPKWYRLAVADRLLKSAPENAGWQRDLSVSYDKIGDVLEAGGNLFEALKTYQESLAIRDRLAKADPNNADRQHDLVMSQDRVATPKAVINGGVEAERVAVNGRVEGPIRGSEVVLKSRAHVVGDIQHQCLCVEPGAYFEGRSTRPSETNVRKAKLTARLQRVNELNI